MRRSTFIFVAGCLGLACTPPASSTQLYSAIPTVVVMKDSPPPDGPARAITLAAAGCWLGGFWSDALGESGASREAGIRARCDDVVRDAGENPGGAYYAMRAVDATNVDLLAQRVWQISSQSAAERPYGTELVQLLHAVADAAREDMHARNAADRVKEVFAKYSVAEQRDNKVHADPELHFANAFRMLYAHGGPYAEDAKVLALFFALDRMEIARGLPKHLQLQTMRVQNEELFGIAGPTLPEDPAAPIPSGTWLDYMTRVAEAAGHPVPAEAKSPENRALLAWNGVLLGVGDQLRTAKAAPALEDVVHRVLGRLDEQAYAARAAYEAHPPAER